MSGVLGFWGHGQAWAAMIRHVFLCPAVAQTGSVWVWDESANYFMVPLATRWYF